MAVSPGGATRYPRPMTSPARDESRPMPGVPAEEVNRPQRSVSSSLACIGCEYDLRGVSVDANCPECGSPVKHTLTVSFPLSQASPGFVARLYWGSVLVLGFWVIWLAKPLTMVGLWLFRPPSEIVELAISLAYTAAPWIYLAGWWLLSSHQSVTIDASPRGSRRRLVRAAVTCCFVLWVFRFTMGLTSVGNLSLSVTGPEFLTWLGTATYWLSALGEGVLFFASTLYIAQIGRRIPSKRVWKWSRHVIWFLPFFWGASQLAPVGPLAPEINTAISVALHMVACALGIVLFNLLRTDLQQFGKPAAGTAA